MWGEKFMHFQTRNSQEPANKMKDQLEFAQVHQDLETGK